MQTEKQKQNNKMKSETKRHRDLIRKIKEEKKIKK